MPTYREAAIVLRTHPLAEADRIITLLTRGRGKVRAVAKGVRRTSSRFGARLEPAMVVDLQCYEGRSLDTVTQAVSLAQYGDDIARHYGAWTAAHVMLETADRLSEEGEPAVQQFHLLAGGLAALARAEHDVSSVLDSYLLRALATGGWAVSPHACARCGADGPHRAFHVASGGAVCRECRPPGSAAPAPESFALIGHLISGDWDGVAAADARTRREVSGLVAAFLDWHVDRVVRSLRLVERTEPAPRLAPVVEQVADAAMPTAPPVTPAAPAHPGAPR